MLGDRQVTQRDVLQADVTIGPTTPAEHGAHRAALGARGENIGEYHPVIVERRISQALLRNPRKALPPSVDGRRNWSLDALEL